MSTASNTSHRTARAVTVATMGHVTGRAVNVLLPFIVIALYGVNQQTDLLFFAMAVALFFYGTMATAITDASVPIIVAGQGSLSVKAWMYGGLAAAAAMLLVAPLWVRDWNAATVILLFGAMLMAAAGAAAAFAAGMLHAADRYGYTGTLWSLRIVPVLIFVAWQPPLAHLALLALGIGIADAVRSIALIRLARSTYATAPTQKRLSVRQFFQSYPPVVISLIIVGLNPMIDRAIAGLAGAGAITILEAGERLYGALAGLATIGLMPVILTKLSAAHAAGTLGRIWSRALFAIVVWVGAWLVVGVLAGLLLFHESALRFTPLNAQDLGQVREIYWYYLAGLPAFIITLVYVRRLQAMRTLWIFIPQAVVSVLLNAGVSLLLLRWIGLGGIALATTIVYTVGCLVLMAVVNRAQARQAAAATLARDGVRS